LQKYNVAALIEAGKELKSEKSKSLLWTYLHAKREELK
jgi:hypothetical protein